MTRSRSEIDRLERYVRMKIQGKNVDYIRLEKCLTSVHDKYCCATSNSVQLDNEHANVTRVVSNENVIYENKVV